MSSMPVSPATRRFQLQLILDFFFLICSLYCLLYWTGAARYAFFGATAQASVVDIQDVYNSQGVRIERHRVDYQYFDAGAKVLCRGSYYEYPARTPALGETFAVEYLPNHADSSRRPDDHPLSGLICSAIPVLVLYGLYSLSVRRGEWTL